MKSCLHKVFPLIFLAIVSIACNPNPTEVYSAVKNAGYIPYRIFLSEGGTGLIVGWDAKNVSIIAPPTECFPESFIDNRGQTVSLRNTMDTEMPSLSYTVNVDVGLGAEVSSSVLSAGASMPGAEGVANQIDLTSALNDPLVAAVIQENYVKAVDIVMNDIVVEYINHFALRKFIQEGHLDDYNPVCRDFILREFKKDDIFPVVVQAIKIGSLNYTFHSDNGTEVKIDVPKLKGIVDAKLDTTVKVVGDKTLIITEPRYMGYQLGIISSDGKIVETATKVKFPEYDEYHFTKMY